MESRVRNIIVALAGSVGAGSAIVLNLLLPNQPLHVSCPVDPEQQICTITARPDVSQCASLSRLGGDFLGPFEEGSEHSLGRLLQALREQGAIVTWHTWEYINTPSGPDFSQCEIEVKLTREQAQDWRDVLVGGEGESESAVAELNTVPALTPRVVLAGEDPQTVREGFDLSEKP